MKIVTTENLTLSYGTTEVLTDVSFGVEEGEKVGIIGTNGCGKTTLLNLLTGKKEATSGAIYFKKGITVGYLSQEGAFDERESALTVGEKMLEAFSELVREETKLKEAEAHLQTEEEIARYTEKRDAFEEAGGLTFRSRAKAMLYSLGFSEERQNMPVKSLSGGQKTRLSLAVELAKAPDLLLLDEPTNHLDLNTLQWLENYLSSYKKSILVVSHDRYFLDHVTDHTLMLENHRAKLYNGGYTVSREQRRIDREIAEKHYENQQKEIARQEAYIALQKKWNREKNIKAAESRQKMLDRMERVEKPEREESGIRLSFGEATESGNDVLEVKKLTHAFGENVLFREISFLIKKGDRAFLVGPNGCGKSTLIRIILGKIKETSGSKSLGYNVRIGYYDQENQNLNYENTALEEIWGTYPNKTETEVRNALARFRFFGEDVYKTVKQLSGGERARLTLCRLMLSDINFLVLDEPTNHLDILSREALGDAIGAFHGTVLTVSHDRYLINTVATRILELKPGLSNAGDLFDYPVDQIGNGYEEYRAYKERRKAEDGPVTEKAKETAVSSGKEQYLQKKQAEAEARKKKNHLEKCRAECETIEQRLEEIETELYGESATDYVRASELDAEKNQLEERLLVLYEELD